MSITFLGDDVAMVVTEGGIIPPGAETVAPERQIRATWVIAKRPDGRPMLVSHQPGLRLTVRIASAAR